MVDLPQVPRRLTTIEAPQTRFMPQAADAGSPYKTLSDALGKLGDGLDQVAIAAAERAGAQAGDSVRKDDAGNLVVDRTPLPIIGNAGVAYSRAARISTLARLEPEIENKATETRLAFPNDPDGFQKAWKAYADQLVGNIGDPALQAPIRRVIEREGGQNYRAALVQADRLNVANAAEAYKARLTELDNQGAALARQGGTDTPEYAELQSSVRSLYDELRTDARFKYPQARIDAELNELASRHKGEAIIGRAMSIYDKATPTSAAEARKFLQESAWDINLNLSPAQRQQIVTRGMASLDGRTAENKAQIDANKKLVSETIEGLKTSAPYDVRRFNDLLDKSAALGDVESYYKLASYQTFHNWRQSIAGLPLPEQAQALQAMRSSAGLVDRIIGAESSGNSQARASTSSAAGLGQFLTGTWLSLIKQVKPELAAGKTDAELLALRTDGSREGIQLQREMVAAYAEQNRQQLAAAGVRTDNGALYLAHFLGPGDAIKVLKSAPDSTLRGVVASASIDANREVFGRNPTAGSLVAWAERKVGAIPGGIQESALPPEARIWVAAVRQEAVNDVSRGMAARAEPMVVALENAVGKGRTPSDQEIRDIATVLNETGRRDLFERVDNALATYDATQSITKMPVGRRQAFQAEMQALASDKSDPKERRVIDATADAVQNIEQGMRNLPYSTGAQRGLHAPPGPLNFDDPAALSAEIDRRAAMDSVHQNHDGVSARSVFEGKEGEAFKAALVSGDARVVAGTFSALQRLGDDQLAATLSGDTVKDAIRGAMRSTDPAKYNAVMASLDAVYARAPESFKGAFGEDATHALMTWQSNTRYMTPEQIAKDREKAANDPQVRERMKSLAQEGATEARKVSFDDVVKQFDSSWWITPGPLARATGSQAMPPTDELTQATLMGDFQTQFARRYAATNGDKDEALRQTMELMKTKWVASPVNGGRLMVNAPETLRDRNGQAIYPAVGGSYDWMARQIEGDIAKEVGKPMVSLDTAEVGPTRNWSYTLVSDRRTQAEAQNGQRATYQVMVTDAETGRSTVLPRRFQFDPGPAQTQARADFEAQRRRALMPLFGVVNPGDDLGSGVLPP